MTGTSRRRRRIHRETATGRRTDLRRALRVAALAAPVYLLAAAVPPGGLFRGRRFRDVGLYGDYADALLDGRIPYRDFFVEYPPGGFLVFTPPAVMPDGWYLHAFKSFMALLGLATLFVVALALVRLGAVGARLYGAVFAVALSPLALGPVSLNTYDAFPALLVVGALAAALYGRDTLAFGLLGVAFAAKLYAAALVPLFVLWLWRSRRPFGRPLLAFGVAVLVLVGPFAVLGWDGLAESVRAQSGRGLQVESLGGAILLAAHRLGLYDAEVVAGSTAALTRDLAGGLPDALATATTVLQIAAIALVALLFLRGRPDGERLVIATAATLAGFLAFARFVSPQYLVWLIPIVPLVAGSAGVVAVALLGAALILGRLWFFHYRELFALEGIVWLVVLRDLALLALYAVLLRTMIPSSSKTVLHRASRSSWASGTAVVDGAERRSR
jgi:Glycosyltransferase family 87